MRSPSLKPRRSVSINQLLTARPRTCMTRLRLQPRSAAHSTSVVSQAGVASQVRVPKETGYATSVSEQSACVRLALRDDVRRFLKHGW
jgi:hypothetical protein